MTITKDEKINYEVLLAASLSSTLLCSGERFNLHLFIISFYIIYFITYAIFFYLC
jgi:hypothetical protein